MAIKLENKPNVDNSDPDYPYGKIKDNTGVGDGTPVNTLVYGDFHQFFAKMLSESGITPNGIPDNDYSGFQYFEALLNLFGGLRKKVVEIGDWDMDANASVNVAHGIADHTKVRSISVIIRDDNNVTMYMLIPVTGVAPLIGGFISSINHTNVILNRHDAASIAGLGWNGVPQFDNAGFDSTSYNRGWIVIEYNEL